MKKLRILAVIFLSCSLQNSNASSGCITKTCSNKYITIFEKNKAQTGLTAADITKYLTDHGYTVTSTPSQANYNWTCYTTKNGYNYFTTVFTDGSKIIGHEDVRL
ncbi:MAG: hypothetical protein JWO44_1201 [Bacteroidetes bacterium]|nr:hypothetical protein [Bacteroidota bacterium]